MVLCAGPGHFATAQVTLISGYHIGAGADAGEQIIARWDEIDERTDVIVPAYGFVQPECELASAGASADLLAVKR